MFRKAAKGSFGSFSAREALFAAFFAGGFLMATWITRTPAIREGLGLSIAEMGLVFLGLSLGSIPSLIFAPVLIHRAGARLMTLLGEALMLLGVFLAALPLALPMPLPGGVVTALGLGLVGFGSVFLDIAMNVAAGVIEARRGKPVLTTLHACFSFGEAVGAFFGFGCVYLAVSPMTHFLMAVGLMALVFLLSTLRLNEVEALVRASGEEAEKKTGALKPKLRITGSLIAAVIVVFVVALCEGTANDWLPILLRESMNASTSFAALAFAVFASGLAAVRFSGTFWLMRFGKRRVLMGSAHRASRHYFLQGTALRHAGRRFLGRRRGARLPGCAFCGCRNGRRGPRSPDEPSFERGVRRISRGAPDPRLHRRGNGALGFIRARSATHAAPGASREAHDAG